MDTLYPATVLTVNCPLSSGAASFYRWLYRWHSQTSRVDASTSYFARKQGKDERTIYRWLKELRVSSYIQTEVDTGVERRIIPLLPPPPKHQKRSCVPRSNRKVSGVMSGVLSGVMSGVPPYIENAFTQDTQHTQSDVVASLASHGVSTGAAQRLVKEAGEAEVLKQVQALPFRKCRDKAAVLAQSIRDRWEVPSALVQHQKEQRRANDKAEKEQRAAVVASYREKCREQLLNRFSGLPVHQKEALEAAAVALYQKEQPAAARLMLGRSVGSSVVQGYALRLLAEETGGYYAEG